MWKFKPKYTWNSGIILSKLACLSNINDLLTELGNKREFCYEVYFGTEKSNICKYVGVLQ